MLSILMSAVLFQISSFAWHNSAMVAYLPHPPVARTALLYQSVAHNCNFVENALSISSMCSQVDCLTTHCSASPANVAFLPDEGFTADHSFKLDNCTPPYEADHAPPFRPPVEA